ncbi:MAG TPA: two-component regulator propeller domain-containing protein, partial [Flavisolibacter sp.]|nr:two-component regulator propeller domain-containing protein [Flavisolibacter sp.]
TDAQGNIIRNYKASADRLRFASIAAVAQSAKGPFWVAYTDGLLEKLDNKNLRPVHTAFLIPASAGLTYDFKMFLDTEDDLWFYILNNSDQGVFYYNSAANRLTVLKKEEGPARLNNNLVNGITQDSKGLIWIATDHGGVNIVDKKRMVTQYLTNNPQDDKSIAQNSVYSVYKDNEGIMWVGTYKRGISFFHENFIRFPVYNHKPSLAGSLPYEDVNRFVEDAKGNLWIGTNGGGLIYFDRAGRKFTQYRHNASDANSLSNDIIVSLFIDHQQKLWIGTYFGGLDMFDGTRFIHYRHNEADTTTIADDRIWEIYEDSQKRLWIGTLASGLDRFDREKNVFVHYKPDRPNSIHSFYISSIMEDKEGNLWFGTAYGVDVLEKKTGKFINYLRDDNNRKSLSNNNVIAILQDSRGWIWIGTRDGLNLLNEDKKSFTVFTTENGLPDNTILTILEDDNRQLWMSTPKGLSNLSIVKGAKGESLFQFRNYDEKDGVHGKMFNESAALKTKKGELVFGGPKGFNLFYPKDAGGTKAPVKIVLTDFELFNRPVSIGDELKGRVILENSITESKRITLRYNQDVFSLEFAALDFPNAEKIKYAYKLEGFNNDWLVTDAGNRKATFTNLDPGDYTFKVRVENADGSWSAEEAVLKITIMPPFWQTPLAYILYVLAAAGILFGARHLTLRRAQMKFALEQERKEAHRLHELDMLKIKFFTNISHEFRTPLSLILAPLDKIIKNTSETDTKKQLTLIQRNAKRLLNLVNLLLDFRRMEVQEFRLIPTEGDIILFIKDLTYSFSDIAEKKQIRLSFHASVGELVTSFDKDKLEKIVFNLLSNAFRFTRDGGKIDVQAEVADGGKENEKTLILKVADTGIGIPKEDQEKIFERFFQHATPGNIVNQGSGLGLAITKEFVKLFNGTITVESEPDKGTCFIVTMPVKIMSASVLSASPFSEEIRTEENEELLTDDKKSSRKATILLVEDNEDFRFYLKDNL